MNRIAHVISGLDTGGAEAMLAKLVGGMDRRRFSNTVISLTDRGQLGEQIESMGITVLTLGTRRGRPDVSALPRLIGLLKTLKPDIVQSWLYHADFLSTVAVKLSGLPILIWNVRCSDMDLTRYSFFTRWVRRILARWSTTPSALVVNSVAGRLQHERLGYHPRRWAIIPNGFDTERFRPDLGTRFSIRSEWHVSDDTVVIALVARVDPMKDHPTFLDAAQHVVMARRNVCFVLVGKDTQKLASAIAGKGLEHHFLVLGYRNDVERLFPAMDILCLSSAFGEGFPNVLGEAMASGVPCVSTDVGDARIIIGDTGCVVPARDSVSLARAVIDLIDRGPLNRAKLGVRARARIETEYSISKIVDQYSAFYTEISSCPSSVL
jgi:glycosyltransferase involved in cell wall biosynthesis